MVKLKGYDAKNSQYTQQMLEPSIQIDGFTCETSNDTLRVPASDMPQRETMLLSKDTSELRNVRFETT